MKLNLYFRPPKKRFAQLTAAFKGALAGSHSREEQEVEKRVAGMSRSDLAQAVDREYKKLSPAQINLAQYLVANKGAFALGSADLDRSCENETNSNPP